ncbi:GtrA family protein [Pseudomonas bohemica]|uniref:GtrA family protein n=1 Tax=Pseudomonas bohemica TaxID=2044872 RepID=UPI000DA60DEA|nr:GtrA family protein [Pseudomonas bohemica]
MKLAVIYTIFAIIATVANLGAQELAIYIYTGGYSVLVAVSLGTGVGLLVKYVFDKRYIFSFQAVNAAQDSRTFFLYTLMGLATTVVFWGLELGFNHIFHTKEMRYVGGIVGLMIGYISKYQLDKRFVFRDRV